MNRICPRCRGVIVASYHAGEPSCLQCGYAGGGQSPTPEMLEEMRTAKSRNAGRRDEESSHGTATEYNHGCRCPRCRYANTKRLARYRAEKAG